MREIEALVAFEGRLAGTDAERRAAAHLGERLRSLGREVRTEPISVHPSWPVAHALHALLAVAGSVVSAVVPVLGLALVLAAAALTYADAGGRLHLLRRLGGRRASQNVVSPEDGAKPGTLLLVAHLDAGRTGAPYARRLTERRATLAGRLKRPIGLLDPVFWSMLAVLACALVRLAGIDFVVVSAIQFVPTALLILAVPLLLDVAGSPAVPGAGDNASGVATALRLAERHGGGLRHFRLWVVLTGAGEGFGLGTRSFLRTPAGRALDPARTVVLNLDEVATGTPRFTRREGAVSAVASNARLVGAAEQAAAEHGELGARGRDSASSSDGAAAARAGLAAITVSCLNALDYWPEHHQPTDTPDRLDPEALERGFRFCSALIERIDAELGPELTGGEEDGEEAEREPARSGGGEEGED